LNLLPHNQILSGGRDGAWRATGSRPQLLCKPDDGHGFKAGWYRIRIRVRGEFGPLDDAALSPDYGEGFDEADLIRLAALSDRKRLTICGTILLKSDARRLRFDPCHSAQGLDIEQFVFRPIGRVSALASLLWPRSSGSGSRSWIGSMVEAARVLGEHGIRAMVDWLYMLHLSSEPQSTKDDYSDWLVRYDHIPVFANLAASGTAERPCFSILLPTYNSDVNWLRACIDSVLAQTYDRWELCIADDGSDNVSTLAMLHGFEERDARVKVLLRASNGHICAATNSALSLATGEFVALLDHDDCLHPDALAELAAASLRYPEWDIIYTDEDKLDAQARRCDPYFKPDFNLDLLRGQNCITHLCAYRTSVVRDMGGFLAGYEGSQDWDLALRCAERVGSGRIGHVPRVLYHWRMAPGSTALHHEAKTYAGTAAVKAIQAHLDRTSPGARVEQIQSQPGNYRVRHVLPDPRPRVSVIIPTRDQPELLLRCVESIRATSEGYGLEFIIVDNGSCSDEAAEALSRIEQEHAAIVLRDHRPFNYSRLNNLAAQRATADLLLFCNDDIEACSEGWLDEMVGHALRPEVGAVGAKLYYPNGKVQHAGVIVGAGGVAAHVCRGAGAAEAGQMNRMLLVQDLSAVTAACLAMRASVFSEAGGFDETLAVTFNDVDLCLRLRAAGLLVVWTPFATLLHHESFSRNKLVGDEAARRELAEQTLMRERWPDWLEADPAYNTNLALDPPCFALAFPPRRRPLV
jgi:O-antigen biosynthesis protein